MGTHSYLETMRVKSLLLVSILLLDFITAFPTAVEVFPVDNVEDDYWTLEEILKNGQFLKNTFNRAQRDFDFLGSRGKKAAEATDFYGVRGKKDFEEFLKRIMERRSDVFTAVRG